MSPFFYRDVDALNDYLHGDNSKTVSGVQIFFFIRYTTDVHILED